MNDTARDVNLINGGLMAYINDVDVHPGPGARPAAS
jgi:hypothetical protein